MIKITDYELRTANLVLNKHLEFSHMIQSLLKKIFFYNLPAQLYFIVFINMVGFGLIIPLVPIIFSLRNFFPEGFSPFFINIILGFLLAAYPIAQFFGAPILGRLSDNHGRKSILLFSLLGSFIGYLLFAFGIGFSSVLLLFLSRVIDGFTGGNISVAMSAVADVSPNAKEKVKNFSMIGAAFAMGFIVGPFLGGFLSNPELSPFFSIKTPFIFAALITFFNMIFIAFAFQETLKEKADKKIHLLSAFIDIKKAFSIAHLRIVFAALFLVNLGWVSFQQFFQILLHTKFGFSPSRIAFLFAYIGLWAVIAQATIIPHIGQKVSPSAVLEKTILASSVLVLILIFISQPFLYVVLPLMAIFFSFTQSNFSTLLCVNASQKSQGQILGLRQSVLSLAQIFPPLLGGVLLNFSSSAPILFGSVLIFFGWIFTLFIKENNQKITF